MRSEKTLASEDSLKTFKRKIKLFKRKIKRFALGPKMLRYLFLLHFNFLSEA